jgi:L-fuconolactonase
MNPAMRIIDAQIHCWYPNTPQRPWPEGATSLHGPQYTIDDARTQMDIAGVERAILVPPPWTGWDAEYSLQAARREPKRFGVVALFNVAAPDAREQLKCWRQPGLLGLRVTLDREPYRALLFDRSLDWFWETAQETKLPLMVYLPGSISELGPILARYPDLRLIIDHAGRRTKGGIKGDALWTDADELFALACYPEVAVKVSSMPSFTSHPYPFKELHTHIRAIYDYFGPQRMLWGSDVTRLTSTYTENIRLFTEALDFLGDEDKEWIMGRSAAKCCDWPL